ncbi:MAG: hypothetical protein WCL08_04300 [Verrucomicrobiota bacterium]
MKITKPEEAPEMLATKDQQDAMEKEFQDFVRENGIHDSQAKAKAYWKEVYYNGGAGLPVPSFESSGLPYLVLQRNFPSHTKQLKWFEQGCMNASPEIIARRAETAAANEAARKKLVEEMRENQRISETLSREARNLSDLVGPEAFAQMTDEQKMGLLKRSEDFKSRIILPGTSGR